MDESKKNPFAPYELQFDVTQRKEIIAPLLIELRKAKKYSQREIANLLGVSPQAYNGWDKGRNEPPIAHLVRLSFLYGISLDTLCGREVFVMPTKDNMVSQLDNYRQQIEELQAQLDSGTLDDNPEKENLQKMVDGMRAVVAIALNSNQ